MTQELTLPERAALALKGNDAELIELAKKSSDIKSIENNAGYQQAQSCRMVLRNTRTNLEKRGKEAREDAQLFSKAIIAEEKRLIDLIRPEEVRLDSIQAAWDSKIEAEKQAKIDAENNRKAALEERIIALDANLQFGDDSKIIQRKIDHISQIDVDASFQERREEAAEKQKNSLAELRAALETVTEQEEVHAMREAARVKAEQEAAEQRAVAEKAARETARIQAEANAEKEKQLALQRAAEEEKAQAQRKIEQEQQAAERAARVKAEQEAAALRAELSAAAARANAEKAAVLEQERRAAAAPDKERMLTYADSLLALTVPAMSTPAGHEAALGIEQAVLSLHKRIVAKAGEL